MALILKVANYLKLLNTNYFKLQLVMRDAILMGYKNQRKGLISAEKNCYFKHERFFTILSFFCYFIREHIFIVFTDKAFKFFSVLQSNVGQLWHFSFQHFICLWRWISGPQIWLIKWVSNLPGNVWTVIQKMLFQG